MDSGLFMCDLVILVLLGVKDSQLPAHTKQPRTLCWNAPELRALHHGRRPVPMPRPLEGEVGIRALIRNYVHCLQGL